MKRELESCRQIQLLQGMDLKEFVAESLEQLMSGVNDASKRINFNGGRVNPKFHHYTDNNFGEYIGATQKLPPDFVISEQGRAVVMVEFDVAVTVTEGSGTKGGIGVFAGAVGLGSQGQSDKSNRSETRIKFKVPVEFPSLL